MDAGTHRQLRPTCCYIRWQRITMRECSLCTTVGWYVTLQEWPDSVRLERFIGVKLAAGCSRKILCVCSEQSCVVMYRLYLDSAADVGSASGLRANDSALNFRFSRQWLPFFFFLLLLSGPVNLGFWTYGWIHAIVKMNGWIITIHPFRGCRDEGRYHWTDDQITIQRNAF